MPAGLRVKVFRFDQANPMTLSTSTEENWSGENKAASSNLTPLVKPKPKPNTALILRPYKGTPRPHASTHDALDTEPVTFASVSSAFKAINDYCDEIKRNQRILQLEKK
ncbi:hypothetical protein BGZ72_002428, partial [Mortierella alpina]